VCDSAHLHQRFSLDIMPWQCLGRDQIAWMLPGVHVVVYVNLVGSLSIVSQFLIAYASCDFFICRQWLTWLFVDVYVRSPFCRLGGAAPIYTSGVWNVGMRITLIGNFRSTIHSAKVSSLAPPLFHNSMYWSAKGHQLAFVYFVHIHSLSFVRVSSLSTSSWTACSLQRKFL